MIKTNANNTARKSQQRTKKMARVAKTSPIEHLDKIEVFASIQVHGKNATLANFQTVICNPKTKFRLNKT